MLHSSFTFCIMQRRRPHCRLIKMTRNVKRSLFRTHVAGLLSLTFLFAVFLFRSHQDWLPSGTGLRENPAANTVQGFSSAKGETNRSSIRKFWKEVLHSSSKPQTNLSSNQEGVSLQGVTGMENSSSTNNSLYQEMGVNGQPVPQPYRYLINEPDKCQNSSPFLILLITAEPHQVDARNAIRQTWGNDSVAGKLGFVRLFLLGLGKDSNAYQQFSIKKESQHHHDIIQQEYQDTYNNLTIKTLMGMNWVAKHCPHACYVMKTDSDMFVNTEYLIQKLLKPNLPPRQNYFTGRLIISDAPNRNKASKWYMAPEMYPSERYPVFCSGTGYVFSGDLAEKIYRASLSLRRLHLEDVFVGICLAKLRIDPVPPPNKFVFNSMRVSYTSCKYSHLITSHWFKPKELIKYWNHLQSNKHKTCINAAKGKAAKDHHRKLH